MAIAEMRLWWRARTRWEQTALMIGSAILFFISVRVFFCPTDKTVYPIFSGACRFWWRGMSLYELEPPDGVQGGYRYSPTIAVLYTPFAIFPDAIGGVLWRLASAAALLGSLAWLGRSVLPGGVSRDQFAWFVMLCLPLSLQSLNNGQANILVTAAMLASVAAVREERWNLASAMTGVAFAFKIYPLALGMLLALLYPRRLFWRIPLALGVSLALPYLFQHPAYVTDQYETWFSLLLADDRSNGVLENMYRDMWLLFYLYYPIPKLAYKILQIAGGLAVAFVCWRRQRVGWATRPLLVSTLGLATAWMMLLGPATESSSFVLLAPSFAWSLIEAYQGTDWKRRSFLIASAACFMMAVLLGGFSSTVKIHTLGVHSWASLFYFIYWFTEPRPSSAVSATLVSDQQRGGKLAA